jgi:antitoxin component YwqK of YwqJK toxin-antitoxin module
MKRILTVLGVLVAVFAIGTFVYTSLPQDWSVSYPVKTKVRVQVPPASTLEDIRYVTYPSKDSTIPEEEQIEYKSGVTSYIFYRADGTIRETTEYWPAVEGSTQRQLKSGSLRTDDGANFLSDKSFRKDGTRVREGLRLADGTYQIDYYFADGTRLERHQLVSADGKPLLEQVYRDNGALKGFTQVDAKGKLTTTTYYADGKTESILTVPSTYYDNITMVSYYPNGVTQRRVEWSSYNITADYFRPDGTQRLSSAETTYSSGNLVWITYDAKGKATLKQTYRGVMTVDSATGKPVKSYVLDSVEELNADGKVTRYTEFADDGVTLYRINVPKPPGSYWGGTLKTFRPDGTLEKVEEKNKDGNVVSTKTYTVQDNVRENLPGSYLVRPVEEALPIPPKKTATPPPYYYGYP